LAVVFTVGDWREEFRREDAMKTSRVVAVIVLIAAGFTLACAQAAGQAGGAISPFASIRSYEKADMMKLERYFMGSLDHPIDGVVESAIREVTRLKLVQPLCCSESIVEKLHELSIEGRTPAMRYKAALASIVFDNPSLFTREGFVEYANGEELFAAIAKRLEKDVLAEKTR
jgi:hypothetical protein